MNKFRAIRTTSPDGITHDSKREAKRWQELQLLERAGQIRNLKRQVKIPLIGQCAPMKTRTGRQMKLTVDFAYEDSALNWAVVYEDAKGTPTRDYEVRKAAAEAMGLKIVES